jgi:2-succinyl-6-hydroxy-2,4-cyclohexadiene-1-carboxylate synthase
VRPSQAQRKGAVKVNAMIRRIRTGCGVFELADEGPRKCTPDGSPPIVLLHGFTGSKQSFRALRRALRMHHRVISFDLPWHGGTTISVSEESFSIGRCAAALVEVLDKLGVSRFALLGYSMGGRVALALAVAYPERVVRLILESASAGLKSVAQRAARLKSDRALAAFAERSGIEAFVRRWEAMALFASLAELPAPVRAQLRRARLKCSARALAACLRTMSVGAQPYLQDTLSMLHVPVLIVVGSRDRKFRTIGRKLARAITGAQLAIIDGAGHIPHLERPEEFNRLAASFFGAAVRTNELQIQDTYASRSQTRSNDTGLCF